jgi:hypothetical protein
MTWTSEKPRVPGWYWTRLKPEGDSSVYAYDIMRVEERWPGVGLVDADDPFTLALDEDCYANYEWAGPLEPPT